MNMSTLDHTQAYVEPGARQRSDEHKPAQQASIGRVLDDYRRSVEDLLLAPVRDALESSIRLAEAVEMLHLPMTDRFAARRTLAECEAAVKKLEAFCERGSGSRRMQRQKDGWHLIMRCFRWSRGRSNR
jgi:hypothetical protein